MSNQTIVAIGAHPDDIEIGCAGTLLNYARQGWNIYYIIASLGEQCEVNEKNPSVLTKTRKEESRKAAEPIGVKEIFYLMLPDTFIEYNGLTIGAVERVINSVKPDLIFTHTLQDNHQDHKNLGFATITACRRAKANILQYETPSTAQSFQPVVFSPISNAIKQKIEILKCFTSQNEKIYLDNKAIMGLARYRGYTSGSKYAEAFEVSKWYLQTGK
jgi:two-component system, NtrC family, response regulator HydG